MNHGLAHVDDRWNHDLSIQTTLCYAQNTQRNSAHGYGWIEREIAAGLAVNPLALRLREHPAAYLWSVTYLQYLLTLEWLDCPLTVRKHSRPANYSSVR